MEKNNERKGEDSIMTNRKPYYELFYDDFKNLSERSKILFFQMLTFPFSQNGQSLEMFIEVANLDYSYCESPIEELFALAMDFVYFTRVSSLEDEFVLSPQVDIETNGNKYRVDFLIENSIGDADDNKGLIIECDGHDFHEKTKEQVRKGLQRDYDLKMAGYDILHFSGSQIYSNPIECAVKAYDYWRKKRG